MQFSDNRTEKAQNIPVSVCIPTYNHAKFISVAIESVLKQTFKAFELIIVDNNSSDDTAAVVSRFKDQRISYFRNPATVSVSENWNKCISLASGKYICLLHADDLLLPEHLTEHVNAIESDPEIGFAFSAVNRIDVNGYLIDEYFPFKVSYVKEGKEQFVNHILGNFIYCPTVMVRKECYEKVGMYEESRKILNDWPMWLNIELSSYKVAYIAKVLAGYRMQRALSENIGSFDEMVEHYQVLQNCFDSSKFQALFPKDSRGSIKSAAMFKSFCFYIKLSFKALFRTRDFKNFMNTIGFIAAKTFTNKGSRLSFYSVGVGLKYIIEKCLLRKTDFIK